MTTKPKSKRKVREVKVETYGYGILNAGGTFWSDCTFHTKQEAHDHVTKFWGKPNAMRYTIIPVKIIPVTKKKK